MNIDVVSFENPITFTGGVETHAVELVRALNQLGHRARLITRAPDHEVSPTDPWGIPVEWIKVPFPRGSLPSYHHARLAHPWFSRGLSSRLGETDIVHSQDNAGVGAIGKVTVVATVHTDVVSEYEQAKRPLPWGLLQRAAVAWDVWRWRRWAKGLAASIAVSPATAEAMRDHFGLDPAVIPNGLAPSERLSREEARARTQTPFETQILYLGRLASVKRVDRVLDVLPRLPETVGFTVAGKGPDRQRLEERADALGVSERVRFLGYVDEAAKDAVLASADAFVLPSEHEGQPITLLEAVAQGVPVVVTELDWLPESLQSYAVEAPLEEDEKGLVAALEQALSRGRVTDVPIPTWAQVAKQTVDVYKDAIADA